MINNLRIINPFGINGIDRFDIEDYRSEVQDLCNNQTNSELNYQIVILGAGKGTRMGIGYPKVLHF